MADATPKKSGLRALFGRRAKEDQPPRKKLSKRESRSEASGNEKLIHVDDPRRQDSGSFTSQSIEFNNEDLGQLPDSAYSTSNTHNYRDSPYAALTHERYSAQHAQFMEEYRRNSEGLDQYAAPLYQMVPSRSASIPVDDSAHLGQYHSAAKATPSKLTKPRRIVKVDDVLDKDTGERKDLTDMMHAFTFNEALDSIEEATLDDAPIYDPSKPDGTSMLSGISPEIWLHVADLLTPLEVANLSSTCRTMYTRLGRQPYKLLVDPKNRQYRLKFLLAMDHEMPHHLFCFPCAQWHLRIQPGLETLKPQNVLNPLFECPNGTNILLPPPRIRISEGRMLPFAFVQLARRAWQFGPDYGIRHQNLGRRWKDPYSDWSHESMYHVTDQGRVLMRVKSQCYVEGGMTTPGKRMLLYSRSDYTPYFSVCSHWKNGVLTSIPKCALDHIPFVAESEMYIHLQLKEKIAGKKATGLVNLCSRCRPMRRCPECPTEYLFELKFVEDKSVRNHGPERFKQALIVTRWSDLGNGRSPDDAEWAAISGENEHYDSFLEIGRRAVSGVFESAFTDTIPGQRILSMNPKKVKADDIGGDWY